MKIFKQLWKAMGFKSYIDYLASDLWEDKRQQKINKYPLCQMCGKRKSTQVHHLTYVRCCNERNDDLAALCQECHKKIHKKK